MTLRELIRECVNEMGDPTLVEILNNTTCHGFAEEETRVEVRAMVERSELRMKDDDIEHDWTYRRGSAWNEGSASVA